MSMVLRDKTVIKGPHSEEPAQELFSQRRKPEIGQFRLQVDRQTKATSRAGLAGLVRGTQDGSIRILRQGHLVEC
jgi:hypothetical protein